MPPLLGAKRPLAPLRRAMTAPFLLWGVLLVILGFALYLLGNLLSILRLLLQLGPAYQQWNQDVIWYSGFPTTIGLILCGIDLLFMLGRKRQSPRWIEEIDSGKTLESQVTVVLTAYNDEDSIGVAVRDFREHPA